MESGIYWSIRLPYLRWRIQPWWLRIISVPMALVLILISLFLLMIGVVIILFLDQSLDIPGLWIGVYLMVVVLVAADALRGHWKVSPHLAHLPIPRGSAMVGRALLGWLGSCFLGGLLLLEGGPGPLWADLLFIVVLHAPVLTLLMMMPALTIQKTRKGIGLILLGLALLVGSAIGYFIVPGWSVFSAIFLTLQIAVLVASITGLVVGQFDAFPAQQGRQNTVAKVDRRFGRLVDRYPLPGFPDGAGILQLRSKWLSQALKRNPGYPAKKWIVLIMLSAWLLYMVYSMGPGMLSLLQQNPPTMEWLLYSLILIVFIGVAAMPGLMYIAAILEIAGPLMPYLRAAPGELGWLEQSMWKTERIVVVLGVAAAAAAGLVHVVILPLSPLLWLWVVAIVPLSLAEYWVMLWLPLSYQIQEERMGEILAGLLYFLGGFVATIGAIVGLVFLVLAIGGLWTLAGVIMVAIGFSIFARPRIPHLFEMKPVNFTSPTRATPTSMEG